MIGAIWWTKKESKNPSILLKKQFLFCQCVHSQKNRRGAADKRKGNKNENEYNIRYTCLGKIVHVVFSIRGASQYIFVDDLKNKLELDNEPCSLQKAKFRG